jgi:uncharacterized protein YlxW (UPF0749 family)
MRIRFINLSFILIGVAVGVILSLQIRARSDGFGAFPYSQLEMQKELLGTFTLEQEGLNKDLAEVEASLKDAEAVIEKRSSRKLQETLAGLKKLAGTDAVSGSGIKITLIDHPNAGGSAFSYSNENFVQTSDVRDLINALFLQDAMAITINGIRILPLTPIQPVFDSILIGNVQTGSPFVIQAIGNQESLKSAVLLLSSRKIQVYVSEVATMKIEASSGVLRTPEFISLINPK